MTTEITGKADQSFNKQAWTPDGDVQSIWRRFGWTPPTEKRSDFKHSVRSTYPQQRLQHS